MLITEESSLTYGELWDKICAASSLYKKYTIKKGDRILIILPNCSELLFYHLGALKIGAISVLVKTEFKICEFEKIIENCRPRALVAHSNWFMVNSQIINSTKHTLIQIAVDKIELSAAGTLDKGTCLVRGNDIAGILYSYPGGGFPRGCALTHANFFYAARGYARFLKYQPDDKILIVLPMSHIFSLSGSIHSAFLAEAAIVIPRGYSPKLVYAAIERHGITILPVMPAMLELIARFKIKKRYDISSLRVCITGGDYLPGELHEEYQQELQTQIVQGYGLTETSPVICNPRDERNKLGTLGIPGRRDIKVKIVDSRDRELPRGEVGEIAIKSPTTMLGYYNLPGITAMIIRKGWFYTGDLGSLDKEGFLHFYGLQKKIFNFYGNKIDPLEVKRAILLHPAVMHAEVYEENNTGKKSMIGSKKILADVRIRKGSNISHLDLRLFCKEKIAEYKIPHRFNIVE